MLAAAFELTGCGIKIFSRLFYFAPLLVLGGAASHLSVFNKEPTRLDRVAPAQDKRQWRCDCPRVLWILNSIAGLAGLQIRLSAALAWCYRDHRRLRLESARRSGEGVDLDVRAATA